MSYVEVTEARLQERGSTIVEHLRPVGSDPVWLVRTIQA